MTTAQSILNAAAGHMQARAATYDKPEGERSMGRAVDAFNAIAGRDLSEAEGWLLLAVLKQVRLFQRPGYHADSAEDAVAYGALLAEAKAREAVAVAATTAEESSEADADSWIKWEGGECPVDPYASVDVRLRSGRLRERVLADSVGWRHQQDLDLFDIIAYRLSKEASHG